MTSKTKIAVIGALIVAAASPALAQGNGARYNNAAAYIDQGEQRDTAVGAGGTAGNYQTGANVGPGRAAMDHTTGN
jgi:hypothetical protein